MELTDASWSLVQSQPRVTRFLGGKETRTYHTGEADRLIVKCQRVLSVQNNPSFDVGEEVRVTDGPFELFNGMVEEADDEKGA